MSEKQQFKCIINYSKVFISILNAKGGVGKTTLAQLIIEYLQMIGLLPRVVQVDMQARLSDLNEFDVTTIESSPAKMRADPKQQLMRFGPITTVAEHAASVGAPVVLDIGANEDANFAHWAAHSDFAGDLQEFGLEALSVVVFTTEQESIVMAEEAYKHVRRCLPEAKIVFVANERFGRIKDLHPGSLAHQTYAKKILPLLSRHPLLTMAAVPGDSFAIFEPHRLRFSDIVQLTPTQIMDLTALGRADSKIARGDVAEFVARMFEQFDLMRAK